MTAGPLRIGSHGIHRGYNTHNGVIFMLIVKQYNNTLANQQGGFFANGAKRNDQNS